MMSESISCRGKQHRIRAIQGFEYYETEHLQTLLKLDFYKGLEAGHLIRKCELCGRLFLLQKGYHTK